MTRTTFASGADSGLAQTNGMKGGLWSSGPALGLQHLSSIVFSWGSSGWLPVNSQLELFPRDLAKLARQEKKKKKKNHGLNKINAPFWSRCARHCQSLWYRMTKACKGKPLGSPSAPFSGQRCHYAGSAPTAHIPSDHSCVWHFKEDYGNEMW